MEKVVKRDGRIVDFNSEKITNAIAKAGQVTKEFDVNTAKTLTDRVIEVTQNLLKKKKENL